jgi:DNA anti-recombination protein RmuC
MPYGLAPATKNSSAHFVANTRCSEREQFYIESGGADMKGTAQIMFAVAMFLLLGCRPTTDKVPKANEPTMPRVGTSAGSMTATNDRTTAQQKLSAELNELDAKMAELKTRAQNAGDRAKAEWEARRPQLEAQRDAAAKKLDELKQSSKEAWEKTRDKTEAAFAEVEKGFKEAWARLKE